MIDDGKQLAAAWLVATCKRLLGLGVFVWVCLFSRKIVGGRKCGRRSDNFEFW
jgi:hypothetical protein